MCMCGVLLPVLCAIPSVMTVHSLKGQWVKWLSLAKDVVVVKEWGCKSALITLQIEYILKSCIKTGFIVVCFSQKYAPPAYILLD